MKNNKKNNIMLMISIVCLICSVNVQARWATIEDAPAQIELMKQSILIHADGTAEIVSELSGKILNEAGRDAYAKFPIYYNHDVSKLEILAAKTIVDGNEYPLNANLIEDKPMASEVQGFDQTHQILLAYPNVKVGATEYLKHKLKILKVDIPGLYEGMITYANDYMLHNEVHIKSELPLYYNFNDPDHYLEIKTGHSGKYHTLDIKLLKPIFVRIQDEQNTTINPKKYPWVFFSTMQDWQVLGQKVAKPYAQILQQPLPPLYQEIAQQAKLQATDSQKIQVVMSKLNESIQYMGDWKTSNGRHVAQDLKLVASKRLGDCKDFSTGTVAILRALGFKANVVLVTRGSGIYDTSYIDLPGASHFNHAMVRVETKDKVYWLDPTNFFSVSDYVLEDIADRRALVLDETNTRLEHIPAAVSTDEVVINKKVLDLSKPDVVSVVGDILLQGKAAIKYTGAELMVSKSSIENHVIFNQGNFDNIIEKKVTLPPLDSRVVTDLNFKYMFKEKNMVLSTNAGNAFQVSNSMANYFIFNDEVVSDAYLGSPATIRKQIVLKNIKPVDRKNLDCKIESPWVDAKRRVVYQSNSVIIEEEFVFKQSWISNETIKSAEFQRVSNLLAKNFKEGVAIVFTN